jgi:NADPH:quinone reductase-like Zn-dependent oxidoreductase
VKGWVAGPSLRDDLPEPSGSIVAVKATSVNAIDLRSSGVLGHDFAGVLEDGSEVFGFVRGGAWAERIACGAFVAARPVSLSMAEAGAAGLAGAFALAYVESLGLRGGERVLVVGANGGAGAFAVQLCVALGCVVVAPALAIDEAFLRGLGVAEVVPRSERPVADSVIDLVSPPALQVDPGAVARLGALIDEHSLRVPICEGFNFGQVPEALEAFRDHKQGKLSVV